MKREFEINFGEILSPSRVNPIIRSKITAASLMDAMQHASTMYPQFEETDNDWQMIVSVGLVMKVDKYALILTEVESEDISPFGVFG